MIAELKKEGYKVVLKNLISNNSNSTSKFFLLSANNKPRILVERNRDGRETISQLVIVVEENYAYCCSMAYFVGEAMSGVKISCYFPRKGE